MIREDAIKILKRLNAAFQFTQKLEEDYVRTEYINTLKNTIFIDCDEAIDRMILSNKKELPTPGELLEASKEIETDRKQKEKALAPDTTCFVCESRGFVIYKNNDNSEYALYCTECEKGKEFQYNGRNNTQRFNSKTDYYSEPVTKYFDTEELIARNMFKKHNIIPMPESIKEALKTLTNKFVMVKG